MDNLVKQQLIPNSTMLHVFFSYEKLKNFSLENAVQCYKKLEKIVQGIVELKLKVKPNYLMYFGEYVYGAQDYCHYLL